MTDEIKKAVEGMLVPETKEVHLGRAVVRQIFKISRIGTVAGCFVTQGTIERGAKARLIREGREIYKGSIDALKRFKDDIKEVAQNFECGIKISNFDDVKLDDVIENFIASISSGARSEPHAWLAPARNEPGARIGRRLRSCCRRSGMGAAMTVATLCLELLVTDCTTLRAKRRCTRAILDKLHRHFNVSVSEMEDHDPRAPGPARGRHRREDAPRGIRKVEARGRSGRVPSPRRDAWARSSLRCKRSMPSHRSLRIAEAIREVVSSAILFEMADPRVRAVTVLHTEVSADLRHATVYTLP